VGDQDPGGLDRVPLVLGPDEGDEQGLPALEWGQAQSYAMAKTTAVTTKAAIRRTRKVGRSCGASIRRQGAEPVRAGVEPTTGRASS